MSGCIIPFVCMELANSCRRPGSKVMRGCNGLGSICKIGRTATRTPAGAWGAGAAGSGSVCTLVGRRAESPLPSALRCLSGALFMSQDLLCQLNVAFSAAGSDVIGDYRLAETGGLCQAYTARDNGLEDLIFEELP